jgi:plasmid stabilization system protein ParE
MPRLILLPQARHDMQRLHGFLTTREIKQADSAIDMIVGALKQLVLMPKMGRIVDGSLRELIIKFGSSGYLALYHLDEVQDTIEVLAIRHQLENDYHLKQ